MIKKHSTRKHSKYPASGAARWMSCAGSVALCEKAPPSKDNKYSIEGTQAHECLEFIMRRFSNVDAAAEQALKKWPKDMVAHAVNSARAIYALRPSKTAKLLIETRVTLNKISPKMFGTLDYAWVELWGHVYVIDYKYGAGLPVLPVDDDTGEPNPQLMYYALGLAYRLNWEFERLTLVIIQPRVWSESEDPVTLAHVPSRKLREFETQVHQAVKLAKSPNAPLVPSEDACRYCPATTICPAVSKGTLGGIDIEFDDTHGLGEVPDPKGMSKEALAKALDAADILEHWINAVRVQAMVLAEAGEKIAGRKLVQKRSIRQWTEQAEEAARILWGDHCYERSLLSPAQLEKKFGKDAKAFTDKHTTNVSSGVTLVKASDKRPEVTPISFDS